MHGALLDPRIAAPDVEGKWGQFIESTDPVKRRWIAHNIENQAKFMAESARGGTFGTRFLYERSGHPVQPTGSY